ncbi:MAG: hypothetical protein WBA67_13600 [Jannaschia sp.]
MINHVEIDAIAIEKRARSLRAEMIRTMIAAVVARLRARRTSAARA